MAAHAGYIRAVAEALEAAGIPVADWRADDRTPRDGWIPFDLVRQVRLHGRPVWDHDQAGLGWDEDHGWRLLTVDDPYGRGARTTKKLDVAKLAAPHSVARAVARLAGIAAPDANPDPPRAEASQAGTAAPDATTSQAHAAAPDTGPHSHRATTPQAHAAAPNTNPDSPRATTPQAHAAAPNTNPHSSRAATTAAGTTAPNADPGSHRATAPEAHAAAPDAGLDFPWHRAAAPDPRFEAALLRYARVAQKSVDASGNAAEGRS